MHKSTVSLALSGKGTISAETRRRIVSVAREMGYEPNPVAQRLARGQSHSTVCLFSGSLDVGLTTEKILLIQRALTARGMEAPLYTCAADEGDEESVQAQVAQVRQLCRQRPRSIICAAQRVHPAIFRELEAYQRSGGLIISYDTPTPLDCDQVIFDREDNAYRAAHHVLEQGHRKIGLGMSQVHFPVVMGLMEPGALEADTTTSDPLLYRLRGFARALSEFDVTPREEWFFRNSTYEKGGAEMARQYLAMRPADRPTALCIVNDYVAMAFMTEVIRAGVRVPDDLSIIAHDNQPIAEYCPVPLTSMTQPVERIAQAVADILIERLSGALAADTPPQRVTITGDLVVRASVATQR